MITTILSDFSRVILNPKDKNYTGTLNELHKDLSEKNIDYSFFNYFEFNDEILNLYRQLKAKYSINVFTTGTIQNRPEIKQVIDPIFEHIYSAKDYGLDKKKPEAYLYIAKKLNNKPNEIIFIDDQLVNIFAAKKAGLHTINYLNFKEMVIILKKYLNNNKD